MGSNPASSLDAVLAPFGSSQSWHEAISHPDGRDRFFRLIQYTLKLIRGVSSGRDTKSLPGHVARIAALESSLAAARQVWRLFKWSAYYNRASLRELLSAPRIVTRDSVASALSSLQDACLAVYLILDNVSFLTKVSLLRGNASAAARRAARAWLASSVLGLVNNMRRWGAAVADSKRTVKPGARSRRRSGRRHLTLAVKYAGDAVIAYSLCRLHGDGLAAHPALVGACGVVSSIVAFSDVWPRYPPPQRSLHAPPPRRASFSSALTAQGTSHGSAV